LPRTPRERATRATPERRALALGLAVVWLAAAEAAGATDYYACDCREGAEAGCRPGDDAKSGADPENAWRSLGRLQRAVAGSACGDRFRLCKGGVFEPPGVRPEWTVAGQDCSSEPRIVESYDAGSAQRRPRLHGRVSFFALNSPGAKGITIRGLELLCTQSCDLGVGAILANVDDVLLDDLVVDGFAVCVQWGTDRKMGVRNSTIRNCRSQGLIGPAGDGSFVTGSTIENNGCLDRKPACGLSHALYWNVHSPTAKLVVRDNTLRGNTLDVAQGGACNGNAMAIRGGTNVVVEDNVFVTPVDPPAQAGCSVVRLATSQKFQKCTSCAFRRNKILGGHTLLQVESWIGGAIENNLLFSPATSVHGAKAAISVQPSKVGAVPSDGLAIRNNSIAVGSGGGDRVSAGIEVRHDPVFGRFGTGLRIASNAIQLLGRGSNDTCFRLFDDAVVADLSEDYNVCGRLDPRASYATTKQPWSLEAWRARYPGQGVHSVDADPAFASPGPPRFDFDVGAPSPVVDAGDPARSAPTDARGAVRPAGRAPDAGAFERPHPP
jgi:hypothetical protein